MKPEALVAAKSQFEELDWRKSKEHDLGFASGLEQDKETFWARTGELEYLNLSELVEKSLVAHGYEDNLENLLFGLENLRFGRQVEWVKGHEGTRVKRFQKVVCFDFPKKGRSGSLLQKLYGLVDALRSGKEVSLTSEMLLGTLEGPKLRAQIAQLEQENKSLREQQENRVRDNGVVREQVEHAVGAARTVNIEQSVPWALEMCTVKEVHFDRMCVVVKIGRRSIEIPFGDLPALPQVQAVGVLLLSGHVVLGLLPVGDLWHQFVYLVCEVLGVNGATIKMRSSRGEDHIICDDSQRWSRHQRAVGAFADGQLIRIWADGLPDNLAQLLEMQEQYQKYAQKNVQKEAGE